MMTSIILIDLSWGQRKLKLKLKTLYHRTQDVEARRVALVALIAEAM